MQEHTQNNIAICGYHHGWHDWYLSINLNSKKKILSGHILLDGLEIDGSTQD